jgi:dolichyl-phosphate-mannose--protein O-mannosyl transferase
MTEMYFDEVYHARTAYEYLNHHSIYEITHPPLGKNLLSLGIYFFGMNPFGWRCVGTLFGVLMVPLMYVFAKRLFKKTLFAFIPTFLLAVDFMHYTQTRIATIDSYSVFFILLMYFFMYLYTETNYNREPLVNTLLPLSLAGTAFALGAATKWLCIYAGAGLAVLCFVQLGTRFREYAFARRMLEDETQHAAIGEQRLAYLRDISRGFARRTLTTLLWCVLYFIIVPLGVYISAYAPYLAPATDSAGYAVRYAFFAFAGLLILSLFAMWMFKIRNDRRAADKAAAEETAAMTEAPDAAGVETAQDAPVMAAEEAEKPEKRKRRFLRKYILAIALCVAALAAAGLFIYYTSFILYTDADQGAYDAQKILENQEYMFNYHSKLNPDHVHPFSSKWYTWPIDYRPVFFFQGHGYTGSTMSTMSTMGNPAVWWGGVATVIAMIVIRIRRGRFGKRTFFLSVAALSQYLPYVFISREMFIYHYFATVVFLMLLMGVLAKYLIERTKYGKTFVFIFLGVCLLLFVMFYPVTTGTVVSKAYSDTFLRWSSMWPFY